MAAAVADHRPLLRGDKKIKKTEQAGEIPLAKNPDLLAEVGAARPAKKPALVGFALETEKGDALVEHARRKLAEKKVDLVVANSADDSFGREDDRAVLVTATGVEKLPVMRKAELADVILDRVKGMTHRPAAR
jgi:phosphopantothenoylcysteine decarboxylase/phosphopantothenate--cysteine ligase